MAEKVKDIKGTLKEMGVPGLLEYQSQQGVINKAGKEYKQAAEKIDAEAFKKQVAGKYKGKATLSQVAADFGRAYLKNLGQDFSGKDDETVHAELAKAAGREYSSIIAALGHGDIEKAKSALATQSAFQNGAMRKSVLNTALRNDESLLEEAVGYMKQVPAWNGHSDSIMKANIEDYLEAAGAANERYQDIAPAKLSPVWQ